MRYLFCHKSGLCGIRTPLEPGSFTNWDLICTELAKQEPLWEPGTAHGYHALTYGHLVGEILRRIDGRTIGKYFNEEIAKPLDLDFWIGLPESEFSRVTNIYPSKPNPLLPLLAKLPRFLLPGPMKFLLDFTDTNKPVGAAFNNPPLGSNENDEFEANTREWRKAEIPAANGHGNARSLAKLYGVLANGGSRDEVHILNSNTSGSDVISLIESAVCGFMLLRKLIIPIALRKTLPSYGNELILMVKATSLVSLTTYMEMTGIARKIMAKTFAPVEAFIAAGILYLFLNFLMVQFIKYLEWKYNPHLRVSQT